MSSTLAAPRLRLDPAALTARLTLSRVCLALLACTLAAQVGVVLISEVKGDEFFMLDYAHRFARGEVAMPLQSIYNHLYAPLVTAFAHEVDGVVAARFISLACLLGTVSFAYAAARRFAATPPVLLALLLLFSTGFVFRHAVAFRVDAPMTTAVMASLFFALSPRLRLRSGIAAGAALGLAGVLTVKAVFFAPMIGIVLTARWAQGGLGRRGVLVGAAAAGAALLTFGGLISLNALLLPPTAPAENAAYLSVVAGENLGRGLFPELGALFVVIGNDFPFVIALGGAFLVAALAAARRGQRVTGVILLATLVPFALSLAFYRNALYYFYPDLMFPAVVPLSVAVAAALRRYGPAVGYALAAATAILLTGQAAQTFTEDNRAQRALYALIHDLYPERVDYIGPFRDVAGHEGHSFFMDYTGSAFTLYVEAGEPVVADLIAAHQPRYLLASSLSFDVEREGLRSSLVAEDEAFLRRSFVRHWGPLYLPGEYLADGAFDIEIAGTYTLEAKRAVVIDGSLLAPGDTIDLALGTHEAALGEAEARLVFGVRPRRPAAPFPYEGTFRSDY